MTNLIRCDKCKEELPIKKDVKFLCWAYENFKSDGYWISDDWHLCISCYNKFKRFLGRLK